MIKEGGKKKKELRAVKTSVHGQVFWHLDLNLNNLNTQHTR